MDPIIFELQELQSAAALVHRVMPPTPVYAWPKLKKRLGCTVWVKHENHSPTGAFKVRGGIVYLDRLCRSTPNIPGVISATRGNHGQSIAFAAARAGVPATIYVPKGNSPDQNTAIATFGASLVEFGKDFDEARHEAFRLAAIKACTLCRPFIATWSPASPATRWSYFATRVNWMPCMSASAWAQGFADSLRFATYWD